MISWDLALVHGSRRCRWVLSPDRVIAQRLSATGRTIPPTFSHLISRMIWTKYTSASTISAGEKKPGRDRRVTGRGLRKSLEVQHVVSEVQAWRNVCLVVYLHPPHVCICYVSFSESHLSAYYIIRLYICVCFIQSCLSVYRIPAPDNLLINVYEATAWNIKGRGVSTNLP